MCLTVLALYCSEFHCKALGFQHQQVHIQVFKRKENHETGPFGNINIFFFKTTQKWHKKAKQKQIPPWGGMGDMQSFTLWLLLDMYTDKCIIISGGFSQQIKKTVVVVFF